MTKTERQRTRVIAIVHSHNEERVIDLSRDLVSLATQKTTKARGKWNAQIVPRRNYLNLIMPNDTMNIYIDPGDGKRGFVRTMMGYVDRVERVITTDQNGATSTRFQLIGSDFQKAVDLTHIYFNSQMRTILDERFARTGDGSIRGNFANEADGSALRNAGVTLFGSPADFVENLLTILMGFGTQWELPGAYPKSAQSVSLTRDERKQRAKRLLPENINQLLDTLNIRKEFFDNNTAAIQQAIDQATNVTAEELKLEEVQEKRNAAIELKNNALILAYRSIVASASDPTLPTGVLDLMSFDFVESLAVDGFRGNSALARTQHTTLGSFLYGNSNPLINELIFDLRPVSTSGGQDGGLSPSKGDQGYSKKPDELRINTAGTALFPSSAQAVKYVPAVIFREYPYSVVDGFEVDAVSVLPSVGEGEEDITGTIPFGPVFSQNPNTSGRHIYEYRPPIGFDSNAYKEGTKALKHIDSVTITTADVVSSAVGRSDEEVINLFELTSHDQNSFQTYMRNALTNFSPILNQISIKRHGLRALEAVTQFADYARNGGSGTLQVSIDSNQTRKNLVRWQLLFDHWYQHNIEYLSGQITLRGMPEIRVGYRLDWKDRNESYYVEGVSHSWQYPNAFQTTVSVSRGQRNDPFPVYIPPVFLNEANDVITRSSGDRGSTGRLADYFLVKDTEATLHSTEREGPFKVDQNETDLFPRGTGGVIVTSKAGQLSGQSTTLGDSPSDLVGIDPDGTEKA